MDPALLCWVSVVILPVQRSLIAVYFNGLLIIPRAAHDTIVQLGIRTVRVPMVHKCP